MKGMEIYVETIKLICFPHAGRLYYNKWIKLFGKKIQMHIVKYPMREGRENILQLDTVQELAEIIYKENEEILHAKYAIWGHLPVIMVQLLRRISK